MTASLTVTKYSPADFREPGIWFMHRMGANGWPEQTNCGGSDGNLGRPAMGPRESAELTLQPKPDWRTMSAVGHEQSA